uniref:Electron transfer flavoprotein subunit beta n=1 Tax=Heterorhabditis bacteriophora TaxID=37862 RepID=A0A1I7X0F7_HETBA
MFQIQTKTVLVVAAKEMDPQAGRIVPTKVSVREVIIR